MRKKALAWLLIFASLLVISGCSLQTAQQEEEGYQIYYLRRPDVDHRMTELTYETWPFGDRKGIELYELMIEAMQHPQDLLNASVFPEGVELSQITTMSNAVTVILTEQYASLPEYQQSLISAAVTLSLLSTGKIDYVKIIAAGVPRDPLTEQYFNKDSFMLNDGAVQNSALNATLYYIYRADSELVEVQSIVETDSGDVTPEAILDALFEKPGNADLKAPFEGEAQVVRAEVVDQICTLDLLVNEDVGFELIDIYAVVNTLCNHPNIDGVILTINGMYLSEYGFDDLDDVLRADQSWVS